MGCFPLPLLRPVLVRPGCCMRNETKGRRAYHADKRFRLMLFSRDRQWTSPHGRGRSDDMGACSLFNVRDLASEVGKAASWGVTLLRAFPQEQQDIFCRKGIP